MPLLVQGGLETTVEESSASMTRELERAVARSNRSFREAAEGHMSGVSPEEASSAAATVKGAPFLQWSQISNPN